MEAKSPQHLFHAWVHFVLGMSVCQCLKSVGLSLVDSLNTLMTKWYSVSTAVYYEVNG